MVLYFTYKSIFLSNYVQLQYLEEKKRYYEVHIYIQINIKTEVFYLLKKFWVCSNRRYPTFSLA